MITNFPNSYSDVLKALLQKLDSSSFVEMALTAEALQSLPTDNASIEKLAQYRHSETGRTFIHAIFAMSDTLKIPQDFLTAFVIHWARNATPADATKLTDHMLFGNISPIRFQEVFNILKRNNMGEKLLSLATVNEYLTALSNRLHQATGNPANGIITTALYHTAMFDLGKINREKQALEKRVKAAEEALAAERAKTSSSASAQLLQQKEISLKASQALTVQLRGQLTTLQRENTRLTEALKQAQEESSRKNAPSVESQKDKDAILQKQQTKIDKLRRRNAELREESDSWKTQFDQQLAEFNKLETRWDQEIERANKAELQNDKLISRINKLSQEKNDIRREIQRLRLELENNTNAQQPAASTISALQKRLNGIQAALEAVQHDVELATPRKSTATPRTHREAAPASSSSSSSSSHPINVFPRNHAALSPLANPPKRFGQANATPPATRTPVAASASASSSTATHSRQRTAEQAFGNTNIFPPHKRRPLIQSDSE